MESSCRELLKDAAEHRSTLTHNIPKYGGWNSALEKLKGIFTLKYAFLSFEKCLNDSISGFQRGDIF